MRRMHCNLESGFQLCICSRTEENSITLVDHRTCQISVTFKQKIRPSDAGHLADVQLLEF
jgi:hypothetical protein